MTPAPSDEEHPTGSLRQERAGDTGVMGFNPFRARRRSSADYLYVAAGLILTLSLVLWAAGVV